MSQEKLLTPEFDAYVTNAMEAWKVPGLAISVVKDDALVLTKAYGFQNVEQKTPVDERTVFAIGSTSKAFAVATLALLVDEGKLDWDDPVTKHLPDFHMFDPWVTRHIKVRDLLCHDSGLLRCDSIWYGTHRERDEILHQVRYIEPSWSFRSHPQYQNIMFLAAGQIVPAITGQSWDEFLTQRIFVPLGMAASGTSIRAFEDQDNVATPYAEIDDEVCAVPWRNLDNVAPAGSINSNVVDMAQWVRLQLGAGAYKGERLISAEAVKEMHTPQFLLHKWQEIAPMVEMFEKDFHFWAYGLGWILNDFHGRKLVWHLGGIDGMSAVVGLIPEENVGTVILTNLNGTYMHLALMFWAFDALLDAPERDWCSELLPMITMGKEAEEKQQQEMDEARVAGTSPSLPLSAYAGTYEHPAYGPATVTEQGGALVVNLSPAYIGDLEHWHFDTFRVTWRHPMMGKTYVSFSLDKMGQVERMKVDALMDQTSAVYQRAAD